MCIDAGEQVLLTCGTQIGIPARDGSRQSLTLVAVVVRHQDRGDPIHTQRGQFVQDRAAAEIDQHGLVSTPDEYTLQVSSKR